VFPGPLAKRDAYSQVFEKSKDVERPIDTTGQTEWWNMLAGPWRR